MNLDLKVFVCNKHTEAGLMGKTHVRKLSKGKSKFTKETWKEHQELEVNVMCMNTCATKISESSGCSFFYSPDRHWVNKCRSIAPSGHSGFKVLHVSGHFNQAIDMSPCFVLVSVLNASVNIYLSCIINGVFLNYLKPGTLEAIFLT